MGQAIQATGIGKRYRLGGPSRRYGSLRESLAGAAASLLRSRRDVHVEDRRDIWALRDVSFEVPYGQVLGIVGRNGAGKSTLLKVLSRITEPTTGRAVVEGRVGALLEVGTGFHPELTGAENVYLNGAILGMSRFDTRRRFDEIVSFAELERFMDTPVKHYSSGMYMRLAFSVAAHLEPEVLVVDEVLAVGDASFQKKCLGKMSEVAGEGRTVLFVSHNMPAVTRLCSRALLLDGGHVVQDGPAPATVAAYLGASRDGSTSREWTEGTGAASGPVRLLGLDLLDADQQPVVVADIGAPLRARLRYRVTRPGAAFRCVLSFDTQGTCAFGTMEPFEREHDQVGTYESSVIIPGHFLAEGEYSVSVSIFASRGVKDRYVFVRDALAFQVVDPMRGDSARGDYAENFTGLLRPKLTWTTSYRESDPGMA